MVKRMAKPKPRKPVGHHLGPVFADPDLVDRIFEYIVEQFPEIRAERLQELKTTTREEFGGAECYIPARSPTVRQQQVAEVLRLFNGRNATEIARRLQISRATVYRWVKQPGHDGKKPSQFSET